MNNLSLSIRLQGIDFCLPHTDEQVQGPEINLSHEKYFLIRPASTVLTLLLPGINNMFWFYRMSWFINYCFAFA